MSKFKDYIKESSDLVKYTIVANDPTGQLGKIVDAIKGKGNVGHSYTVVIDPDDKPIEIDWDGDGPYRIYSIKMEKM